MPRADPTRSSYCATRHLLRNLDDAAELRRNPLVRSWFARSSGDHGPALARVRGLVHATLARCRERAAPTVRTRIARMHAALLRCEIDRQPLAVVAAELGLSDRQVRRERRAAHDEFFDAFGQTISEPGGAIVRDVALLRIAQAEELHELGQTALATAACEDIAAHAARPERRIEALCLAAEVELAAGRFAATKRRLAAAASVFAACARDLGDDARAAVAERIDLGHWMLRHALGEAGGLSSPPPLALAHPDPLREPSEARRALIARAIAQFTGQRWELGDVRRGDEAVRVAHALAPTLAPGRVRERLAIMYAEARMLGLRRLYGDYERLLAVERLAAARGHVRTFLVVRADRINCELTGFGGDQVLDRIVRPFDTADQRAMPFALAFAACAAADCELDAGAARTAIAMVERLAPSTTAISMLARSTSLVMLRRERRNDEARALAHGLRRDAERAGNERLRGGAMMHLAWIASAQRRWADARRYTRDALGALEQYGTPLALTETRKLARRLAVE